MKILKSIQCLPVKIIGYCLLLSLAQVSMAGKMPPPATERHKADIVSIIKASKSGIPMPLDMSNPLHHRFFMRQMESVSVTPDRYPQLYKVIEAARKSKPNKVETRSMSQLSAASPAVSGDTTTGYAVVPIQTFTALGTHDGGTTYSASALSSVPSSIISTLTVALTDTSGNSLGTPVQITSATESATDLNAIATGTATTQGMPVVGLATYYYEDQFGTPFMGTVTATVSASPTSITNNAPMPNYTTTPPQTLTKLCLGRTGTDCTYSPPGGTGTNVIMPVQGSVTFGSAISTTPTIANVASVIMAKPDTGEGGGCHISNTTDFFSDPNTVINGNTISWNFANMQFEAASGCLTANSTAIYNLTLGLTIGTLQSFVSITSSPSTDPTNPNFKVIPELQVFYSCLAEGTLVTLKGGKKIKIENIEAGQKVVVDATGRTAVVESKLRGKESVPIIALHTAKGRVIKLTRGHPVITDKGPVLAGNLRVGDAVMTQSGPDKLTQVSTLKFDGYVWNLNIGKPPMSLNDPKVTGATFLAEDIIVGDNVMQFVENRKDKINHAQRSMHHAPARWARDIQSAVEDAAAK
jgi:hypothetical protein